MTALHDTDELTCPRCGDILEGEFGERETTIEDSMIRTPIECPSCDAPLEVVIESALPDALGVNIWVEDRHEEE